jgi:DNA-binding NtrC family response regulator
MTTNNKKSSHLIDFNKTDNGAVAPLQQNCLEALKTLTFQLMKEIEVLKTTQADFSILDSETKLSFDEAVRNFEKELIRSALIRCSGNQTRAANLLGLKLSTLNTKMKRLNIKLDSDK